MKRSAYGMSKRLVQIALWHLKTARHGNQTHQTPSRHPNAAYRSGFVRSSTTSNLLDVGTQDLRTRIPALSTSNCKLPYSEYAHCVWLSGCHRRQLRVSEVKYGRSAALHKYSPQQMVAEASCAVDVGDGRLVKRLPPLCSLFLHLCLAVSIYSRSRAGRHVLPWIRYQVQGCS